MSRFASYDDMVAHLEANPPLNRMAFLRDVRFATLGDWGGAAVDQDVIRAVACAASWRWIHSAISCPVCESGFHLGLRTKRAGHVSLVWRGPSPKAAREGRARKCWCYARVRSVAGAGVLRAVHMSNWLDFLGVSVMWSCDYPKSIMGIELKGGGHQTIDRWCEMLQVVAAERMAQPGVVELGGFGAVVELGETLLNRTKTTRLILPARNQQRWLWGAVEELNTDRFTFKVRRA